MINSIECVDGSGHDLTQGIVLERLDYTRVTTLK